MLRPDDARELVKILDTVEELFLKLLQGGDWQKLDELREQIPAELAETRYRLSGSQIDDNEPDRGNVIRGTYRRVLAGEIVRSLFVRRVCDVRQENGVEEVRLAGTPTTGTGVPPTLAEIKALKPESETAKMVSATSKQNRSKAPPVKAPKEKPARTTNAGPAEKQPVAKSLNRERPRKRKMVTASTNIEDMMVKYFGEL